MSHVLDRPVWSALDTRHRIFAYGDRLARCYPSSIVPFAASGADDAESLQALASLIPAGESVFMLQADPIALPPELTATVTAFGVQMVAEAPLPSVSDERVQQLTQDDAAEMLALASLTKPGPFTLKALSLGEFWGVKIDGRLAAMAGERMKQPGYSELSGVCSHPEFAAAASAGCCRCSWPTEFLRAAKFPTCMPMPAMPTRLDCTSPSASGCGQR